MYIHKNTCNITHKIRGVHVVVDKLPVSGRDALRANSFLFMLVYSFWLDSSRISVLSYLSHDTGTSDIRVCIYKPTARPVHLDVAQWGRASPADNDAHTTVWRHTTYRRHRTEMDLVLGVQVWVLVAVQTHARHYGGVIGGVLSSKCAEKRHSGGDREKHAGNKHQRGEQDGGSTRHTTVETTHNKSEKQWKFRQIHRSPRTNAQPLAHVMWHHCIVFLKNCSDVKLGIHFKYLLSSNLALTVALRPKLLPFQGLEKGNHSLVHMGSDTEPKYPTACRTPVRFMIWPSHDHLCT